MAGKFSLEQLATIYLQLNLHSARSIPVLSQLDAGSLQQGEAPLLQWLNEVRLHLGYSTSIHEMRSVKIFKCSKALRGSTDL